MADYRLTRAAENDLIAIYQHGHAAFGERQADRYHADLAGVFDLLASFPYMAELRTDIQSPVYVHPHKSHIILYDVTDGNVVILRVRHAHEDWKSGAVSDE